MNRIEKDPLQSRIEITNWIFLAVIVTLSLLMMSPYFALGVFLGGLISILNFHWLYRDLKKVFSVLSGGSRSSIMFKYYFRFIVTAVVLLVIIKFTRAGVIGLLVGLSLVIVNMLLNIVINYFLSKKPPAQDEDNIA